MRGFVAGSMLLLLGSGSALAQVNAARTTQPVPGPTAPVRADPLAPRPATPAATAAPVQIDPVTGEPVAAQPVPEVAPPPPPPPVWQPAQVLDLLAYVRGVGKDGLDPRDYDPDVVEAALKAGDPVAMSEAATATFDKLAKDLALGHVRGSARVQWFVKDPDMPEGRSRTLLDQALAGAGMASVLDSLLPTHPQYGSLRAALAKVSPTDTATVGKIRLNMDRWRWLPRDLGAKYIIVNVPGEHATLVENSVTRWKHRAIAGATKTPTPQLAVQATGVILNPWWEVPPSLSAEVAGKNGYVAVKGKDGKVQRWRQPPGPGTALGKIKFVMYNPQNIYLHDTNNRGLFDSKARFFSHGCIRTESILDLATELLGDDGGEWTAAKIDDTLKANKTVQANFVKPVPVYIVYFSLAALTDGNIVKYADLYNRDAPVLAALNDRDGGTKPKVQSAAR
jgi:murein L,D-transpeptidase YcbB/YkuD